MACYSYPDTACLNKLAELQAELAANNAAIKECNQIINAFDSDGGVFDSLDSCSASLECTITNTIEAVPYETVDWSNLKENRDILSNYRDNIQEIYDAAVSSKAALEASNAQISASISALNGCPPHTYCDINSTY